eukprot:659775-Amphidinium_carterae.3
MLAIVRCWSILPTELVLHSSRLRPSSLCLGAYHLHVPFEVFGDTGRFDKSINAMHPTANDEIGKMWCDYAKTLGDAWGYQSVVQQSLAPDSACVHSRSMTSWKTECATLSCSL